MISVLRSFVNGTMSSSTNSPDLRDRPVSTGRHGLRRSLRWRPNRWPRGTSAIPNCRLRAWPALPAERQPSILDQNDARMQKVAEASTAFQAASATRCPSGPSTRTTTPSQGRSRVFPRSRRDDVPTPARRAVGRTQQQSAAHPSSPVAVASAAGHDVSNAFIGRTRPAAAAGSASMCRSGRASTLGELTAGDPPERHEMAADLERDAEVVGQRPHVEAGRRRHLELQQVALDDEQVQHVNGDDHRRGRCRLAAPREVVGARARYLLRRKRRRRLEKAATKALQRPIDRVTRQARGTRDGRRRPRRAGRSSSSRFPDGSWRDIASNRR